MTSHQQGSAAYFQVEFLDQPGGTATDPSAISLSFLDDDGDVVAGPFTAPTRVSQGLYAYTWEIPAEQALGDYSAAWTATINGSTSIGYEAFEITEGSSVVPGPVLSWASVADVSALTGVTVDTTVLMQAQGIVDLFAGRTYAAVTRTGTRDAEWLKRAVAYQAAWILQQPDLFARLDFTSVTSVNGSSSITESALTLAPLARMALKKASWLKSRSLHVRAPFQDGPGPLGSDPLAAANDSYLPWSRF
jgi:hypothetical protein